MSRENHYINIPRLIPSVTSVQEVVRHFDHKRNSNVWFMRIIMHNLLISMCVLITNQMSWIYAFDMSYLFQYAEYDIKLTVDNWYIVVS